MSDTKVYEPSIRSLHGTASHFYEVVVLESGGWKDYLSSLPGRWWLQDGGRPDSGQRNGGGGLTATSAACLEGGGCSHRAASAGSPGGYLSRCGPGGYLCSLSGGWRLQGSEHARRWTEQCKNPLTIAAFMSYMHTLSSLKHPWTFLLQFQNYRCVIFLNFVAGSKGQYSGLVSGIMGGYLSSLAGGWRLQRSEHASAAPLQALSPCPRPLSSPSDSCDPVYCR